MKSNKLCYENINTTLSYKLLDELFYEYQIVRNGCFTSLYLFRYHSKIRWDKNSLTKL